MLDDVSQWIVATLGEKTPPGANRQENRIEFLTRTLAAPGFSDPARQALVAALSSLGARAPRAFLEKTFLKEHNRAVRRIEQGHDDSRTDYRTSLFAALARTAPYPGWARVLEKGLNDPALHVRQMSALHWIRTSGEARPHDRLARELAARRSDHFGRDFLRRAARLGDTATFEFLMALAQGTYSEKARLRVDALNALTLRALAPVPAKKTHPVAASEARQGTRSFGAHAHAHAAGQPGPFRSCGRDRPGSTRLRGKPRRTHTGCQPAGSVTPAARGRTAACAGPASGPPTRPARTRRNTTHQGRGTPGDLCARPARRPPLHAPGTGNRSGTGPPAGAERTGTAQGPSVPRRGRGHDPERSGTGRKPGAGPQGAGGHRWTGRRRHAAQTTPGRDAVPSSGPALWMRWPCSTPTRTETAWCTTSGPWPPGDTRT